MRQLILKDNEKFVKVFYTLEDELTLTFEKQYKEIISSKSFFIKTEKQFRTKNFKDSKCDGFVLVWENPSTPLLYITELELEKHSMDKHILPQIGDFISFIQRSTNEDLNELKSFIYAALKKNKNVFKQIQTETDREVYELIDNALEDLQVLLVIDRMIPELSIGLSQIERAINIKIRKIEVSKFLSGKNVEIILYSDSEKIEITSDNKEFQEEESDEFEKDEYTIDYHIKNKPEKISQIVNSFIESTKNKAENIPTRKYIGFFKKDDKMIFSCVAMKKTVIFYSRAPVDDTMQNDFTKIKFRDVKNIGHYTNQLPTEIVISDVSQLDELLKYFDTVLERY